jgi:uncharacterized membrane protein SirB2
VVEFAKWLQFTPLSLWIQSHTWITPTVQAIHVVMIGVVFGSVLMIALRVLGRMRADEPFAAVWQRFAPWLWTGLVVLALTGIILIIGEPVREFTAKSFWAKMILLVLGIVSVLSFRRTLGAATDSQSRALVFARSQKAVALSTLLIWALVIFFGRAIAYDGEIWTPLVRSEPPAAMETNEGVYAWTSRP